MYLIYIPKKKEEEYYERYDNTKNEPFLSNFKKIMQINNYTFVFFSFLCLAIWKKGSSKDFPFFPLMEGLSR